MNDPVVQTIVVSVVVQLTGAVVTWYLWTEDRNEVFLLFWSLAWLFNGIRWALFYLALESPVLRQLASFEGTLAHLFFILGSYDLLPAKPWRRSYVIAATAVVLLGYSLAGAVWNMPTEMEYARGLTVLAFMATCMARAYFIEWLAGYAFAAVTIAAWGIYVVVGLAVLGPGVSTHIVIPMFSVPLLFSIVVIAYQRSRRQLMESERTLQQIFDTAPAPILITQSPSGAIERANSVAYDILGLSSRTVAGKTTVEGSIAADDERRGQLYADLERGSRVTGREVTYYRGGTDPRTLVLNAASLDLKSGRRYIFSFFDVTDLRRAEQSARESEQRRWRAEQELRQQRDELAHALRVTTLGELAASFAHELGQPLTAILSNAQALRRILANNGSRQDADEVLADIAAGARRAGDIIQRLQALFRKEQGVRVRLDMNALVDDVLRLLKADLLQKQIQVCFTPAAELPPVLGDSVQLRQVVLNVLVNAGEAILADAGSPREIYVETRRTEHNEVTIIVRDTGVGAAEADLERMFSHFITTKPQGLGMGLAISRSIIESHEGRIWAACNEPRGLALHIVLPAS
jgi:PAS domain S-box-containing protein